ncbi:MAG: hypothetical protein Ct9H300mP11_13950 [Chloroflexota bacterium]|nr:MAG: hypothetical protein Ct9H300mP11_13950 [Chloroflexota bacterium]
MTSTGFTGRSAWAIYWAKGMKNLPTPKWPMVDGRCLLEIYLVLVMVIPQWSWWLCTFQPLLLTAFRGVINLDDVTAFSAMGDLKGVVVEGFEEQSGWRVMAHQGGIPDKTYLSGDSTHGGMSALQYSWEEPISKGQRGIHLPPGPFPFQQLEALVIG